MRDDTEKRGPAPTPDPANATDTSVSAGTVRRPGEWPSVTALRAKWAREHARRTWAYGAIREHLAEQPSPTAIRKVARLWARDILHLADELVGERLNTERHE
jgi:hypothetical protein